MSVINISLESDEENKQHINIRFGMFWLAMSRIQPRGLALFSDRMESMGAYLLSVCNLTIHSYSS